MAKVTKVAVVNMTGDSPENRVYTVIKADITKENGVLGWAFASAKLNEANLLSVLQQVSGGFNVEIKDGKVVGKGASLDRFKKCSNPMVIISELVLGSTTIGYKVAGGNGVVRNIKIKDLIGYCERATRNGDTPIQNAMFVSRTQDREAYIRNFEGMTFIQEVIKPQANPHTQQAKPDMAKAKESLNKLTDIFTKEQIEQLRIGKSNGVDIRIYANPKLSPKQMEILRNTLEDGNNPKGFASPEFNESQMKFYRYELKYGHKINGLLNPKYDLARLDLLSRAMEAGASMKDVGDPKIPLDELSEIVERIESGFWKVYEVTAQ